MQGSLGEKIGEGAFSEAYSWAPGQVVKLFKAGVSHLLGRHEVRVIRAVRAAGVPVPEVFGEVTLDGRFGIVLERKLAGRRERRTSHPRRLRRPR